MEQSPGDGLPPAAQYAGGQPQNAYMQVALIACGNFLAFLVGLLLWQLWDVLSDFREPLLYALLASIALRGPKEWLIQKLGTRLAEGRWAVERKP